MKVGVIGAGTMGQGIAKAFAQVDGYEVALCDIKQEWAEGGKDKIAKVRCSNEWSLYSGSHILWVWNIERTGFLWNLYSSASACRTDPDTVCESVWVFPKIFCLPCQCRTADAGRNL